MAQWEEKLGAILNNPQAMSQIMSIAQSLDGGQSAQENPGAPSPAQAASAAPDAQAPAAEAVSPPAPEPPVPGLDLDPRLMEVGMRALAAYQDQDNSRGALLQALRPFVKEERQSKIDKAVQITRMSKVVRAALDGLRGGED